ncbi:MAG: hypothetical protein HY647_00705 [Acidobacteria bacterium]|nr:hypothetical protein [Acidobacteriota bacterium]
MPPSCWAAPTTANPAGRAGYFGNVGRNTLILPGFIGTDFSVFKNIPLGEERALQFRAEFFNLANHPNFGPPVTQIFSNAATGARNAAAGEISSTATNARLIQLALKFTF